MLAGTPALAPDERLTYCRVCEAHCGLVATVSEGRVVRLRPDAEHPMSHGYACPKGIAMVEIQNDPDRVLHPLRRRPDGSGFDRVSWDDAMDAIAARLQDVRRRHGDASIGWYGGVPYTFSFGHFVRSKGFIEALGSPHFYGATSQDIGTRLAATRLLYGDESFTPVPDLARTRFLLCLGSNPLVSNGSFLTAPRIRERLLDVVRRGGRVVVVDPRRTETARAFEHVPVRPDSDAWLLAAMLATIFDERLEDAGWLERHAEGAERLRDAVARFSPELAAQHAGVEAETVRALARDFAQAPAAVAYGRTGACRGRFSTVVCFLLDALNASTGNLDRPGGALFAESAVPLDEMQERSGGARHGETFSRVGGFPVALGELPTAMMAKTITTPGRDRLRALFVSGGNPVNTVPNAGELREALQQLDLFVSIDLYVNDSNRFADYVLPATTWLERSETANVHNKTWVSPFIQYAEAPVAPYGEAREEWQVVDELARRVDVAPMKGTGLRRLNRAGLMPSPRRMLDLGLRLGRYGDRLGLRRRGLSLEALGRRHPHGVRFLEHHPTGDLSRGVRHPDGRVRLFHDSIGRELERLERESGALDPRFPLRLLSLRELRSHNSWTHNSPKLMRNRSFAVRVHPDDAAQLGLADGQRARIVSRTGAIEAPVRITDEMVRGAATLPWGWGHDGGWRRANRAGGSNINELTSSDPADLEPLTGMSWLNGIPVRLEPVEAAA